MEFRRVLFRSPGFAYAASGRELRETWRTRMTNSVQGAELVPGWLPVYGPDTIQEIETLLQSRKSLAENE